LVGQVIVRRREFVRADFGAPRDERFVECVLDGEADAHESQGLDDQDPAHASEGRRGRRVDLLAAAK